MRLKGKLIKWSEQKAFGFIAPNGGGNQIFIHKNAFSNRTRSPKINDVITYSISKDQQGRYCADKATFLGEKLKVKQTNKFSQFSIYLALLFIVAITVAFLLGHFPKTLMLVYIVMSVITFLAYAQDKFKAQKDAWRTPENTLHVLSLIGGWPGAALAQQLLRHKTQKKAFRIAFWFTVMANLTCLLWLFSPSGGDVLSLIPSW